MSVANIDLGTKTMTVWALKSNLETDKKLTFMLLNWDAALSNKLDETDAKIWIFNCFYR